MLTLLLFVAGFVLLLGGAHYLVVGSASLAQRLGVSQLVIGLTVVALGTSAPELAVSVLSSIRDANDLALGNIIGSNIANTLMIIGAAALMMPLALQRATRNVEIPMCIGVSVLLAFLCNDRLFLGADHSVLGRIDGLVLVAAFGAFCWYIYRASLVPFAEEEIRPLRPLTAILMVLGGILGLGLGGHWLVEGAVATALALGVSEALIGLTIVSVGTSLPELATSVVAARKSSADMAIGNVIGSNLINVLWILGLASLIDPIDFNETLNADLAFLFCVSVILALIALRSRYSRISRPAGGLLLALYAGYLVFLVWREMV